ncbi:MAG: hypothetical protein K2G45_07530 [Lachnospiraceae bacterium]|nr:hypothetical protein [Lachnospiraceae bacterium]
MKILKRYMKICIKECQEDSLISREGIKKMPRPILKMSQSQTQTHTNNLSRTTYSNQQQQVDKIKMDKLLRKSRSKEYMDAIHKLDAGGHAHNQNKLNDIINIIKGEFPEIELSEILLGYVAICYLGKPYEVHTLDIAGGIIEHYKAGQTLPNGLEQARSIAMRGGYDFIEVYVDCCRAISSNGAVSVIYC